MVALLQLTPTPLESSGQWDSFNALPHCSEALGNGALIAHCHIAWEQYGSTVLWSKRQRDSFSTVPHIGGGD